MTSFNKKLASLSQSDNNAAPRPAGHMLVSDLDNRDPISDLHDIETGKFLSAIDALPALVREDLCSSDIRVQLDADGRIVKVIKRRNPEFLQGTEREIEVLADGTRVPSNEDLGLVEDSEDVYSCCELVRGTGALSDSYDDEDVEFSDVDEDSHTVTEYSAPMDRWDVVFDATAYIQAAHQLQQTAEYRKADAGERQELLEKLGDEMIYSADLFPCARDKRVRGLAARLLSRIQAGDMTKAELGKLTLGGNEREKKLVALRAQVRKSTGKARGKIMLQAQAMRQSRINAMRNARGFVMQYDEASEKYVAVKRQGNTVRCTSTLSQGEISMLWDAFRQYEAQSKGAVALPAWQFKRALTAKLQRLVAKGELTQQEAKVRYQKSLTNVLKVSEKDAEQQNMVSLSY
jgi:hypothetical protein